MDSNIAITLVVLILVLIFVGYNTLYAPTEIRGQVSSFTTSNWPLICTQQIEFYGGAGSTVICNPQTDVIQPNQECYWRTKGYFIQEASCKQNDREK